MTETQGERVSVEQIVARYHAGTMGYDSCIRFLMREYGMTEVQADDTLLPRKRK